MPGREKTLGIVAGLAFVAVSGALTPTAVADNVATVTAAQGERTYYTRLKAARNLSERLNRASVTRLYEFLQRRAAHDPLPPEKLNALKNDVANALVNQKQPLSDFGNRLIEMHNNPDLHQVWRDYCIQFLASRYKRARKQEERKRIKKTLRQAADKDWTIAGTALLSLERLGTAVDREKLGRKALEVASDDNANSAARISALQVCAETGEKKVLPLARELAGSNEAGVPLRVSAIGVIGLLGNTSDSELLRDHSESSDVRLRTAARKAIQRVNSNTK